MDVVDLDRRAAAEMATVLASTARHQYEARTPCPAWKVRDLIAHVLAGVAKYSEIAEGGNWTRGAPEVSLPDDPVSVYRPGVEAMLHAWAHPECSTGRSTCRWAGVEPRRRSTSTWARRWSTPGT